MKRQLLHLTFLLLAIFAVQAQDLTVCTYNLRYKNSSDTEAGNGWNTRRTYLINLMNFQQPDLLGVQEAYKAQMDDMANGLSGYAYIGVGRDNGTTGGEYSAIFYRKERMVLLDHGDFWLSDWPWKASKGFPSQGGGTSYKRICTWGKFFDKVAGVILYHFNTHMDLDETNRQQSYYLIKKKIEDMIGSKTVPIIITGDYNAVQTGDTYKLFYNSGFLYDCHETAKKSFITNGTCPGFNSCNYSTVSGELRRIDHIFVTKAFIVNRYGVLNPCYYSTSGTANYHLRAFSDHSPVLARLSYSTSVHKTELDSIPAPVNGYYQISNAEELRAFSNIVNGYGGYTKNASAKAILLNDIDMTGEKGWVPIGTDKSPFSGTFDGKGHTIKNLAVTTIKSYSGLFGYTSGATIKNFDISGSIKVPDGYVEHGAIGYASGTNIIGVNSSLNITTSKANDETRHVGGVAGSLFGSSTLSKCSYAGTLTDAGTNTIGGIVGYADGTNNKITYAINAGKVQSTGATTNTGGILGYVNYAGFKTSYCANVGEVSGNEEYTGQIIGRQLLAMTTPPSKLYYLTDGMAPFGSGTEATSATGATAVAMDDVTRGELTYLMNDSKSEGSLTFYQNIDDGDQTDLYPVLYTDHKIVYQGTRGEQLTPEDETNYYFYVNDGGHLADLSLVNAFTTPVAFTADQASYTFQPTGTWGTLYLPFTVESNETVQFYEILPEQTEGSVLAIAPCHSLGAYTPGLYQLIGTNTLSVISHNMPVALPPTDTSVSAGDFQLTGTFEKLSSAGGYVLNGNSFHLTTGNVVTNPFEAFLTAGGTQPQEVTIHIVDATGLNTVIANLDANEKIYNLAGQRITKVQRGINIINGKKYIIK